MRKTFLWKLIAISLSSVVLLADLTSATEISVASDIESISVENGIIEENTSIIKEDPEIEEVVSEKLKDNVEKGKKGIIEESEKSDTLIGDSETDFMKADEQLVDGAPAARPIPALTGNQGIDAANIAKSQLGYQEESENITCYGPDGAEWCAYFASWAAYQATGSREVWPYDGSTTSTARWFINNGRWHDVVDYVWRYEPGAGDVRTNDGCEIEYIREVPSAGLRNEAASRN